jgi:hypothetical protein
MRGLRLDPGFFRRIGSSEYVPTTASIRLANATIPENSALNSVVGGLNVVGGSGLPYTFTITVDADNKFAISGANLIIDQLLDHATKTSHSVTVQASDGVNTPITQAFTVTVTKVADAAADLVPDAFSFTAATGVTASAVSTSGNITVAGLSAAAVVAVEVQNGQYRKNGGSWVSTPGTAVNGDTFAVRGNASATAGGIVVVTLTIGGVSAGYSITTTGAAPPPEDPVPAPVNITAPVLITTAPVVGQEARATPGVWPVGAIVEKAWQTDASGEVLDATSEVITAVDDADVGKTLRYGERAAFANSDPSAWVWTSQSTAIAASGTPEVAALAVTDFTDTSVTFVYPTVEAIRTQWRIRPTGGTATAWANISPSNFTPTGLSKIFTATGLTPLTPYNLLQIRHETSPGVFSAFISATGVPFTTDALIAPSPQAPAFSREPTVTFSTGGAPRAGTVVSGDNGILVADPVGITFTYRYLRRAPSTGAVTGISGATASSYTVATADIGFEIAREVTASNVSGSAVAVSAYSGAVVAEPTAPPPTTGAAPVTQLRYGPPNRVNPRVLKTGDGSSNVTFNLSIYQDFEITSDTPTVAPTGSPRSVTINNGRNGTVRGFNAGARRIYHRTARGHRYHEGIQWNGDASFEIDPLWVAFTHPENGAPHRLTIQGCRMIPAPGTWESHGSFFIPSASCTSGGTWTISGASSPAIQSVRDPAVGDVIEIIGGTTVAARGRWVQITACTPSTPADGSRAYAITGTDVTPVTPSPMAVSTTFARSGIAVEEFRQSGSTITLKVAGMASVSTTKGFLLNRVRKANGDTWHTVNTIYGVTAWNAGTRTATLRPRNASYIPAGDFVLTDVKAVYYDSYWAPTDTQPNRFLSTRSNGLTNHSDNFQGLNHSLPFEARAYGCTFKYVYQIARFNATAKLIDVDNCDMERIDQYDTNYPTMFPVEVRSQAWDIGQNGTSRGYRIRFNKTKFKAQSWRSFLESQAGDPESYSLIDSGRALAYTGSAATATGWESGSKITIWDAATDADPSWWNGDRVPVGAAFGTTWTYAFPAADGPSTGLTWRIVTAADIRSVATNTPLAEFFVDGPADRDITWTVTMTGTATNRFQMHTDGGFSSSAIAKGSAAIAAGTHSITLQVVSSGPHTVGYTRSYTYNVVVSSTGQITSIALA